MRLKKEYAVALSLSLVLSPFVERKTVKKRRGFVVRSSRVGLLRFLLSRERRLKKEKRRRRRRRRLVSKMCFLFYPTLRG